MPEGKGYTAPHATSINSSLEVIKGSSGNNVARPKITQPKEVETKSFVKPTGSARLGG